MWIKFRKKYLLPIKWRRKRIKEINNMRDLPSEVIYDRLKKEEESYLLMLRGNRAKEANIQEGKIEILKWLIYGESKVQDN